MKRRVRKNFFITILFSHICILLVLLATSIVLYRNAARRIRDSISQANQQALEQLEQSFQANFDSVELLLSQLSMNTDVRNFLIRQRTNEIDDAFALRSLLKNLSSYSLLSGFYGDFYIWFWNSDYVISRKDAYSSREFFELSYPKGESYEAWAGTRKQNTPYLKFLETSVVGLDSVPKRVLEYAVSLPLGVGAGLANGCISVLVDEQSVRQMLARIGDGQESFAYLADAEGTIITSVSPDGHIPAFQIDPSSKSGQFRTKIDSRETYISYTRSSNGK